MKKYAYSLGRSVLGGFSNSVGRLVVNVLPIYPFIFIRHFLMVLMTFLFYKEKSNLVNELKIIGKNKSLLWKVILSSLLSGIGTALFYSALKLLPVSIVSIFENGIYMIFTICLSVLFLKEKLSKKSFLYVLLSLFGLFLIITKGNFSLPSISLIGILLLTLNAFMSAVGTILTASVLKTISALTSTMIKSASSAIVGLILMLQSGQSFIELLLLLTVPLTFYLLYGVLSGFFIKYLHNRSIQIIGSSKTAIFSLLTPVLSALFAMIIFKDWFNVYQYIGMFFVILSIYKLR